jgi:hypothetical protein
MEIHARFYRFFLAVLISVGAVSTLRRRFRLASALPPEHKKELDYGSQPVRLFAAQQAAGACHR